MAQKPSIPKGTRDFGQAEMARRNYIFDTIRSVFTTYGYAQIETPAMENLSTLLGKYGDEGDKLLFRILNSGDAFSGINYEEYRTEEGYNSKALSLKTCEKGLRYDLTVPFARYVVQHQSEITFPFKIFQMQPVWRADRPQKGRYREFFQCDADVVGSDSLLNEVELMQIIDTVFTKFGIRVSIRINNSTLTSQERARIESERMANIRRVECELAMRDLDKVIEYDPQFVYAYYNRAFICAKLNNFDAAVNDLDLAIQYYPNFAEAYYTRGLIRLRQGRTKDGIADLSKAGELGLAQAYSVLKRAQQ